MAMSRWRTRPRVRRGATSRCPSARSTRTARPICRCLRRLDGTRTVFRGLAALEPKNAQHLLHLGSVEHAAGKSDDAIAALTEFIDADLAKDGGDVARALLLRAEIVGARDRAAAALDLTAA